MKKTLSFLLMPLLFSTLFAQSYRLVLPKDNYVTSNTLVTFKWSAVDSATSYELMAATDAAFAAIVYDTTVTGTTVLKTLATGQTYYWRIKAYRGATALAWSYIRSFSIFRPSQIPGLVMWFDAGQNVTTSGTAVSQWGDLSPTGLVAVQNTANNKPTLLPTGLCGKPVLHFTGTGGASTSSNMAFATVNVTNYTHLAVRSYVNNNNYMQYVLGGVGQGIASEADFYGGGFGTYTGGNNCIYASVTPQTAGFSVFTTQNDHVFRNSTEISHSPAGANSNCFTINGLALSTIGARTDAATLALSYLGDIGEMLLYDSKLDSGSRLLAEGYLRYKFAAPVDLGPDTILDKFCVNVPLNAAANGACYTSYLWSTGATTASISVTNFGTYWVQATDALGYKSTDTIRVRPRITFNQLPANVFLCARDTVKWNTGYPATGYQFAWSNGKTTPDIDITTPGTYSVSITDAFSCVYRSAAVAVTVDPFPNFTLGPDTSFCSGNRLNFNYTDSLSYILWSTGDAIREPVIIDSGYYHVVAVNANGCVASDTIHVAIKGYAPNVDFTAPILCATDSILFKDATVPPTGNIIVHWTWNFGGNDTTNEQNPVHVFTTNGTNVISLTAQTDSGCVNSTTKTLQSYLKPHADFQSKVSCALAETQFLDYSATALPAGLATWKWHFSAVDSSSGRNPVYTFTEPGKYNVMLYVTNTDGCDDTKSDSVEVFAPFQADFSATKVCLGDSTVFKDLTSSLSIVSWLWNTGDNFVTTQKTFNHKFAAAGEYNVNLSVQNAIGCIDSLNKTVTVYPAPKANFGPLYNCEDKNYAPLDSSIVYETNNSWNWTINGTSYYNNRTPQYYFADTGSYTVKLKLTSQSGCRDSVTKTVRIKPTPRAAFSFAPLYGDAPLDVNFTNESKNADTYMWNFGDGFTDNAVNPSHTFTTNDTFTIKLNAGSIYGCFDSASKNITVIITDLDVAVDDVYTTSAPQPDGTVLVSVTGLLTNVGTRLITHMKLYATIGSGGVISEEIDTLLQQGHQMAYPFLAHFVVAAEKSNSYICVEAKSVNHDEQEITTENNRQCKTLTGVLQLLGPSPNPARSTAYLGFILPKSGKVTLDMVNLAGQVVLEQQELDLPRGRSDYNLDIKKLRAGEYVIRIKYNDDTLLRKIVIN